ncbi:BLI-3 blue-light-inducible Bli-3 protein [Verticillium nonalfalfae]|uniref:BLI-3 blue-light-inducible Bli-3 protein n=1 Tax=Verticillium nonalfalfae TaxID=1051616 RepID=A0A3M9Y279_9PEZI|nr:BLI-3 blue-light-inducible Bli-3 protein [Verticillium nonalfalfae]RNJ53508.1 BLI-3 blue-light-inducible Bli-3 protein [Verticillium nonalfalfae]
MSNQQFSNADTGNRPADPYKDANKDEVPLQTKIEDLTQFINATKFAMMTTRDASSGNLVSRAMALAASEVGGIDLLFHTNTESNKTDEIKSDPHVNISFINSSGDWASVSGVSEVVTDRSLVKKHYSSELKAWLGDLGDGKHDGSENDPRIGIIRVKTNTITYAVSHKTFVGKLAQVAEGIVTGSAAQVNKLREISSHDIEKWRASQSLAQ